VNTCPRLGIFSCAYPGPHSSPCKYIDVYNGGELVGYGSGGRYTTQLHGPRPQPFLAWSFERLNGRVVICGATGRTRETAYGKIKSVIADVAREPRAVGAWTRLLAEPDDVPGPHEPPVPTGTTAWDRIASDEEEVGT
jgi:hypothetical protein